MTKNFYDLLVAIVTAVELVGEGVCVFLAKSGKVDTFTATAIGGSFPIAGNAVLGICARFIKDEKKE